MTTRTPANASLPTDARAAIESFADRVASRGALPEPARQDARGELVSHLFDAARENAGTGPPSAAHAQAAIDALGGEAGAEATFFAPRRTALPTASFGRRAGAYLIDIALAVAVGFFPLWLLFSLAGFLPVAGGVLVVVAVASLLGWIESKWGRTPGKALTGLRVVGPQGALPTFREGFLRNLTKGFPVFALADYVIGALLDKGQHLRLCDRLAGTRVVREPTHSPAPSPMVAA
jgi:uncharacterized RDD family membrane protein YckC